MGRFGFGKKGDDAEEDTNRLGLFGSRSKSKSPAPASNNPYAQPQIASDPYMQMKANDPYTQAKAKTYGQQQYGAPAAGRDNYGGPQPGGNGGPDRYGGGAGGGYGAPPTQSPYNDRQGGYGGGGSMNNQPEKAAYGANRYGTQDGYGGDRYESSGQQPASRYGPSGYGGLGRTDSSTPDDEDRNALFGGAKDRVQQQSQQKFGYGEAPPYQDPARASEWGVGGEGAPRREGAKYGDRQLTAEEEEEEDVTATKQQIRQLKQEDVSSTRNALRIAQQAEEVGRDTLARLGAQGEHIHNTEKNLDLAHNQNRIAEEKARELKTLNQSMFAVHISNPFTAKSRREARDQAVIDKHLDEKEAREATRRAAYMTDQRMQQTFKDLSKDDPTGQKAKGKNLAERAKYQFEADSEDEEMENEIDSNLDALAGATGRLNALARATGQEVDLQNQHLDRISQKGDRVDLGIATNRAKLDRIR